MGKVIWMRHGTCEWGFRRPLGHAPADSQLSVMGVAEVEAAAREILSSQLGKIRIFSSPLPRAAASARVLGRILQVAHIEIDAQYEEWRAPDCVRGLEPNDYPEEYRRWQQKRLGDPRSALQGGESLVALTQRATIACRRQVDLAGMNESSVIVSHRMFIGAIAALMRDTHDPSAIFAAAARFTLPPGGIWRATSL